MRLLTILYISISVLFISISAGRAYSETALNSKYRALSMLEIETDKLNSLFKELNEIKKSKDIDFALQIITKKLFINNNIETELLNDINNYESFISTTTLPDCNYSCQARLEEYDNFDPMNPLDIY
jgi:hypothetical protein